MMPACKGRVGGGMRTLWKNISVCVSSTGSTSTTGPQSSSTAATTSLMPVLSKVRASTHACSPAQACSAGGLQGRARLGQAASVQTGASSARRMPECRLVHKLRPVSRLGLRVRPRPRRRCPLSVRRRPGTRRRTVQATREAPWLGCARTGARCSSSSSPFRTIRQAACLVRLAPRPPRRVLASKASTLNPAASRLRLERAPSLIVGLAVCGAFDNHLFVCV